MSVAVGASTTQTPSTPNFGGLKKRVAAYVQGSNLASVLSDAGDAINAAVDRLNVRNWEWMQRQATITFVADQKTYTLPTNFKRPRKFKRLDSSSNEVDSFLYLPFKDFEDSEFDDTASGTPYYYTIRNASDDLLLSFNVAPSSSFVSSWPTGTLSYYARMGHFADDGDTLGDLEVPPEVRNFLVWYGRWELASFRDPDRGKLQQAERAFASVWADLIKDDRNQQTDWYARGRYR